MNALIVVFTVVSGVNSVSGDVKSVETYVNATKCEAAKAQVKALANAHILIDATCTPL